VETRLHNFLEMSAIFKTVRQIFVGQMVQKLQPIYVSASFVLNYAIMIPILCIVIIVHWEKNIVVSTTVEDLPPGLKN